LDKRRGWTKKRGGFRGSRAWRICWALGEPLRLLPMEVVLMERCWYLRHYSKVMLNVGCQSTINRLELAAIMGISVDSAFSIVEKWNPKITVGSNVHQAVIEFSPPVWLLSRSHHTSNRRWKNINVSYVIADGDNGGLNSLVCSSVPLVRHLDYEGKVYLWNFLIERWFLPKMHEWRTYNKGWDLEELHGTTRWDNKSACTNLSITS
jgi:hypothetical protein